ncbi:outer membrane lipoprotein carrier protein LolA [Luteolibacter algae]|uniref:Outer membrane lipoprotein carrier protein LolA n=1 Tax=Luteolibacter algae TaxID=454151 RepID=A0ABW5D965_9BACT
MRFRFLCILSFALGICQAFADELTPLRTALENQAKHKTVSVDLRQTKKIPALTDEIRQQGHLWMIPGKSFRWELGKPLVQSAIYDGSKVFLMDETRKSAVELEPDDRRAKPLLMMLGIGEGASLDRMLENFSVSGTNSVGHHFIVSLSPKGRVKRALESMVMQINTRSAFLERIEWTQKDGTIVITEFFPPVINKPLPKGVFEVKREAYTWE